MQENKFSPNKFFSFKDFGYLHLFDETKPAWDALEKLKAFFNTISFKGCPDFEGVYYKNRERISIGEGSYIAPTALIEGPCIIGKNVEIRHGAYIRAGCLLDDDVVVGHSSEVVRSILLKGAKIPHFNYVGDSILGYGVNLGAGTKCANFRLDGGVITISYLGERIKTGVIKLGAILGDGVSVGCNAVLNPGTLILPHGKVGPCTSYLGGTSR